MKGLKLAEDLVLPVPPEILKQHVAVLGKTRSGKSSVMRGLVEHLLARREPVCIVDPKGDWWGIKLAADGKGPGYPVVIFGGDHADVPINEHAGAHVAELFATGNRPCLIDLGGWMVGPRTRFWIDFASTLFKHTRGERWLVVDEIHNFAPKGKVFDADAGKALHWTNRLASEGLGKGLAMLFASQRPQKVHNDTLTSAETLIAMRVLHPSDRGAVAEWIKGCGDADGGEVLKSLAQMARGEGWVWSPEIGFGPERVQFPLFRTYDSFRPQAPDDAKRLTGWAEVDLDEVRAKMDESIERAKADDPKELKRLLAQASKDAAIKDKRISELEARVGGTSGFSNSNETKKQEVPVLTDADRALLQAVHNRMGMIASELGAAAGDFLAGVEARAEDIVAAAMKDFEKKVMGAHDVRRREFEQLLEKKGFQRILGKLAALPAPTPHAPTMTMKSPGGRETPRAVSTRPAVRAADGAATVGSDVVLKPMARAMLIALAQHPDGLSKKKIRVHTGYADSGPVSGMFAQLLAEGWAVPDTGRLRITDAGLKAIGSYEPLPGGDDLRVWLLESGKLSTMEKALLRVICEAYPRDISKGEAREAAGYADSGPVSSAFAHLVGLDYVVAVGKGRLRAAEELFS